MLEVLIQIQLVGGCAVGVPLYTIRAVLIPAAARYTVESTVIKSKVESPAATTELDTRWYIARRLTEMRRRDGQHSTRGII